MAKVTDESLLNQGDIKVVSDMVFGAGTGSDINITSVGSNLPALAPLEFFEVRGHSLATNNGLYQVISGGVTSSLADYECDKVSALTPVVASTESASVLGATGVSSEKSIHIDVAANEYYVLEQGNVDSLGVNGPAYYQAMKRFFKDDDYLPANADFPMNLIDNDAGKLIMGNDGVNNNGATFVDNPAFSIRTRKLLRDMGWTEVDVDGNTKKVYPAFFTLGTFEDSATDNAEFQFGTDTTVDDVVAFDFPGPVNEAILAFEELGNPTTCDFATASTITRASGSFITEGYKVGGQVTVRNADNVAHNGTYVLTAVVALTLTVTGTPFTGPDPDTNAILAVDNLNAIALKLRVRDGDPEGKTFSQSNLASAGETVLGGRLFKFPLANSTDLKITATDATITGTSPQNGMSIEFFATPQARAGLVGGSFNFGIIVDGNNGTSQQVFEFIQWSLRQSTDIDAGAGTNIGKTIALLAQFIGDVLEVGSADGGISFPVNPEGGGAGVYIDNLNSASANDVRFWDNTGTRRQNPESIPVTVDFNEIAIDDAVSEFDLYYDRTIRTAMTDLVITAGATPTFTSAGTQLPNNAESGVGSYMRVSGLTGGDAAMNGVYQITAETTPGAAWDVVRYDGAAVVSVTAATANVDQNCINTPDAIIVNTNISVSAATISFTAPDTMGDSGSGFGSFASGDFVRIEGTTSGLNDGIFEIDTAVAGTITFIEQTFTTQGASPTVTVTKVASGLALADFVFSYDFDGNVQGGRVVSTDTFVKAKSIGRSGSQYIQSDVNTITSGTPLTIPMFAATERNGV
jgi:hypothetical protein